MKNNLDLFINFKTVKATVRLGDNSIIESFSGRTVIILAKISLCHVSSVDLEHVLWVPSLGSRSLCPGLQLFLWRNDFP